MVPASTHLDKYVGTPVRAAYQAETLDIFLNVLGDMGYDPVEVIDRNIEVQEEWLRRKHQENHISQLTGGGVSTDLDMEDLAPAREGLTAQQPRVFEVED
jgi:hypothetical protein